MNDFCETAHLSKDEAFKKLEEFRDKLDEITNEGKKLANNMYIEKLIDDELTESLDFDSLPDTVIRKVNKLLSKTKYQIVFDDDYEVIYLNEK